MKNIIFILLFSLLTSCGSKNEDNRGRVNNPNPIAPLVTSEDIVNSKTFIPITVSKIIGDVIVIDEEIEHFLDSFIEEADVRGYSITKQDFSIVFDKSLRNDLPIKSGVCDETGQTPVVRINPYVWYQIEDARKEISVFHELGHCLLGKHGHNDNNTILNGIEIPETIMKTQILHPAIYEANREYYLDEFFR
jgi:hypothetical protein